MLGARELGEAPPVHTRHPCASLVSVVALVVDRYGGELVAPILRSLSLTVSLLRDMYTPSLSRRRNPLETCSR